MNANQLNSINDRLPVRTNKNCCVPVSAVVALGILASFVFMNARTKAADAGIAVTKTPYTVTSGPYTLVSPPERAWIDEVGVLHIRGFAAIGPMAGDYGGSVFLVQDENIDTITGDGDYHGYFVWETVIDGQSGTFEGHYRGNIHGFNGTVLSGLYTDEEWVAHGKGGLEGKKIMGTTLPGTGLGPYTHLGILFSHAD